MTVLGSPTAYTYTCGCVRHVDQIWTLCEDCASRIGKVGTCLACGGPADEWWMVPKVPESRGCSPECAARDAAEILDAAT
jgi:hypothetical protein